MTNRPGAFSAFPADTIGTEATVTRRVRKDRK